jgi:hypothetical protein
LQAQAALVKKPSRCDSPDKAGGAALESFDWVSR